MIYNATKSGGESSKTTESDISYKGNEEQSSTPDQPDKKEKQQQNSGDSGTKPDSFSAK